MPLTLKSALFTASALALVAGAASSPVSAASGTDWLLATGPSRDLAAPRAPDDTAAATRRHAVVIGNADYSHAVDLDNAATDARAMTRYLRAQGFSTSLYLDLDKRGFERMLRRILFEVGPDSELLFYFAGHGIQMGRRNYLLPVDAELSAAYDAPFETVTLDSIVEIIGSRARLQLVMLDSCRNNPFSDARMMTEIDSTLFETREGFSVMSAPVNSLVAYSTSPGAIAFDGLAGNSPFTDAFLANATRMPEASLRDLLDRVRRDVYDRTGGKQVPWESSTLIEPYFVGRDLTGAGAPARPYGANRGLSKIVAQVSEPRVSNDASPVSAPPATVTVSAPLDRRIDVGTALAQALRLTAGATVSLDTDIVAGRLVIEEDGAPVHDYLGTPLGADALGGLVFEYIPEQRPATGEIGDYAVSVEIPMDGPAGTPSSVTLELAPDPCDFHAGDWLDPEGVGIVRYPNDLRPEQAAEACRAATGREPQTGRFHYQLGRALQAGLDYDGARAAFETARDLGHSRAWHALGDLVAEAATVDGGSTGGPSPQEALELYATGVEHGDPYAYHALGKQLLRFGKTDAARRYGFDLLGQAIELGHTFAMNELGYYFLDDGSDHFEPERGLRYLMESAARDDIYGFNNLGLVYDRGLGGVEADAGKALDWYSRAAEGGHPFAPINIGRMYYAGRIDGTPDPVQAISWYDRGLARGNGWGGANAAWIIANDKPDGFTPVDAAVRAARAAVLRDEQAAGQAFSVLAALDARTIETAIQTMIRDFKPDQVVDGRVGPQTRAALAALAERHGVAVPPADLAEELLTAARIYWKANGIRIDLY